MTPDAAREALYRRLYAVWPEWTDAQEASIPALFPHEIAWHLQSLAAEGRLEAAAQSGQGANLSARLPRYRVNMGLAA